MKALKYAGAWDLRFMDVPPPQITKPEEVIVKVSAVGICGTDLGIASGIYNATPGVTLGHEICGTVYEVGRNVKNYKPGDRVYVDPTYFCGQCRMCTSSRPNHCMHKLETESGVSSDGAFSEFYLTQERFLFPADEKLSDGEVTLAEPLSCCLTGTDQIKLRTDARVAVLGSGPMGLLYCNALHLKGLRGSIIEISPARARLAEQVLPEGWGIFPTLGEALRTSGEDQLDLIADTTGVLLDESLKSVTRGGTILLVGLRNKVSPINQGEIADKSISIVGSIDSIGTFQESCRTINARKIRSQGLVTKQYPLSNFAEAFLELGIDLQNRKSTFSSTQIKVTLNP